MSGSLCGICCCERSMPGLAILLPIILFFTKSAEEPRNWTGS